MGTAGADDIDPRLGEIVGRYLDEAHQVAPDRLVDLVARTGVELGAGLVRIWLADHEQRKLIHLDHDDPLDPLAIETTVAGRCFVTSEVVERPGGDAAHAWFPLLDGVDRIGVLEVEAAELTPVRRTSMRHLASLAAAELVTRGQYTDRFTVTRRRKRMNAAAELQWQALPPPSFTAHDVSVAGLLEPAYDVGGDTFDYAHDRGRLDVAIFDAVGHDLTSAVICTLTLGTYRNQRRSGADLRTTAAEIDLAVRSQLAPGSFATGQLAQLDTETGAFRWLNAGHPLPLVVRDGQVFPLACHARPPFGLGHLKPGVRWEIAEEQLQPGDGLLFFTDGVVEARGTDGEDFGDERLAAFLQRAFAAGTAPQETVRRLSHAVLDFHGGVLRDDATMLLVVWQPDHH